MGNHFWCTAAKIAGLVMLPAAILTDVESIMKRAKERSLVLQFILVRWTRARNDLFWGQYFVYRSPQNAAAMVVVDGPNTVQYWIVTHRHARFWPSVRTNATEQGGLLPPPSPWLTETVHVF